MRCPSCGAKNIPGNDLCSGCGHDLHQVHTEYKEISFASSILCMPVCAIPAKPPTIVDENDGIISVLNVMKDNSLSCVLIRGGEEIVGIFTQRDILRKLTLERLNLKKIKIKDVMSGKPLGLEEEDTIAIAINKMAIGGYRHLPIRDKKGKVTKLLTVADLFTFLAHPGKTN